MRLRKQLTVASLLILALNLWASGAEIYKNQYNDQALYQLLENAEWKDPSEQEDIIY